MFQNLPSRILKCCFAIFCKICNFNTLNRNHFNFRLFWKHFLILYLIILLLFFFNCIINNFVKWVNSATILNQVLKWYLFLQYNQINFSYHLFSYHLFLMIFIIKINVLKVQIPLITEACHYIITHNFLWIRIDSLLVVLITLPKICTVHRQHVLRCNHNLLCQVSCLLQIFSNSCRVYMCHWCYSWWTVWYQYLLFHFWMQEEKSFLSLILMIIFFMCSLCLDGKLIYLPLKLQMQYNWSGVWSSQTLPCLCCHVHTTERVETEIRNEELHHQPEAPRYIHTLKIWIRLFVAFGLLFLTQTLVRQLSTKRQEVAL